MEENQTTEKAAEGKKKKYKIVYNRPECIGAAACAAIDPTKWVMKDDGKADLIGGKEVKPGVWEIEIEEGELEINKDSAEGCPVNVIHIYDLETGEKLV